MRYFVGIDLGGTKIRVALAGTGGHIFAARNFSTGADQGATAVLRTLQAGVDELLSAAGCSKDSLAGLGLCTAGFYNRAAGIIIKSPNLPGWEAFPLRHKLEERFGLPIVVENDANAAAYGEFRFGAGRGRENLLLLTLGTGIGGGLVLNGRLYHGHEGLAGEIGHIPILPEGPRCGCGRFGCLETLASGTAIAREGRNLLAGDTPTLLRKLAGDPQKLRAEDVFAAARQGDAAAFAIVEQAAFFLGRALAITATILNPDIIILSGGMAACGEQLLAPVRRYFSAAVLPPIAASGVPITEGQLAADSGIRGILALLEESISFS